MSAMFKIFVNTNMAAQAVSCAIILTQVLTRRLTSHGLNGALAGLVSITAEPSGTFGAHSDHRWIGGAICLSSRFLCSTS